MARLIMRLYIAAAVSACGWGLYRVYAHPPRSMQMTRDGVPYFTPPVLDPATGKAVPVETLVRHYKGGVQ